MTKTLPDVNHTGTEILFEPCQLAGISLRNRVCMAPMTRKRSPGGIPTADVARYYRRRGEGGIGLVFSEGTFIDHPAAEAHAGRAYENIPRFFGDDALRGWEAVLREVRQTGAAFIPQLWHVGEVRRLGMQPDPAVPGIGPRKLVEDGIVTVSAMDEGDVEAVAASYARAALRAREMGCDGVALHAAHGYLLDQFLWPESNPREDDFGGSIENRCRVACRVVAAIKDAVGDFPVVFRFSQWKMTDYAARIVDTPQELGMLLQQLAAAGVDAFDVSTRRFWEAAFPGSEDNLAAWTHRLGNRTTIAVGSIGLDQPHHSKFFREQAVIDANVTDLDNLVEAMQRGDFDLASVGRAVLADPDWARKVHEGRLGDIRPFVRADLESYF